MMKHPVITVFVAIVGILWLMGAIANNLPAPDPFTSNKPALIKALEFDLPCGYGAGRIVSSYYHKYAVVGDPDWLAYGPKVAAAIGYDKQIDDKKAAEKAALKVLKENFKLQFSLWNGSHDASVAAIKEILNDPGSFDHIETRWTGSLADRKITVYTTFRAKNGYGWTVLNIVKTIVVITDNGFVESVKIVSC